MILAFFHAVLTLVEAVLMRASGLALLAAAVILTESVVERYALRHSTYWQDETAIFLLVGAVFLSAGHVQAGRGHVAIEALASLLPARAEFWRQVLADVLSTGFVGFFALKAWTLTREAWVDGQTTISTFAPPLWIPYSLMAVGMSLLTLRLALQVVRPGVRP